MIPLAILNGALRQLVLEPSFGTNIANPISGLILCGLIFIVSIIFIPKLGKGNVVAYIKIGLLWVLLTIIFETVLGLIMGSTFTEIISAYNIITGNLWLIIVLFMGFVPWLVAKMKRII
jgi:hypothetical protein